MYLIILKCFLGRERTVLEADLLNDYLYKSSGANFTLIPVGAILLNQKAASTPTHNPCCMFTHAINKTRQKECDTTKQLYQEKSRCLSVGVRQGQCKLGIKILEQDGKEGKEKRLVSLNAWPRPSAGNNPCGS